LEEARWADEHPVEYVLEELDEMDLSMAGRLICGVFVALYRFLVH